MCAFVYGRRRRRGARLFRAVWEVINGNDVPLCCDSNVCACLRAFWEAAARPWQGRVLVRVRTLAVVVVVAVVVRAAHLL